MMGDKRLSRRIREFKSISVNNRGLALGFLMKTWHDLEKSFREMVPVMQGARVDGQWGCAGEFWRVAAPLNLNIRKRFEALAHMAGEKLLEHLHPGKQPDDALIAERDPIVRWYKGIWKISHNFESGSLGREMDKNGNVLGYSYSGSIWDVAEASATFCLELATRFKDSLIIRSSRWKWLFLRMPVILLILLLGIGALFSPYAQSWEWLQNHPNKIGLYILAIVMVTVLAATVAFPKYWKWLIGILCGALFGFAQIASL